jgi:hypothetical protein
MNIVNGGTIVVEVAVNLRALVCTKEHTARSSSWFF